MNLLTAQDAIKTQLGTLGLGMQIDDFPENVQDYQLLDNRGAVLVRYQGAVYERPEGNRSGTIEQERRIQWAITAVSTNLFSNNGLYAKMELIRAGLTNFTLTGLTDSTVLYPVSENYLGNQNCQWWYEMIFEHATREAV